MRNYVRSINCTTVLLNRFDSERAIAYRFYSCPYWTNKNPEPVNMNIRGTLIGSAKLAISVPFFRKHPKKGGDKALFDKWGYALLFCTSGHECLIDLRIL
jgi:hypothetical protein